MTKASAAPKGTTNRGAGRTAGVGVERDASTGQVGAGDDARVKAVLAAAERSGLLQEKHGRIGGRISTALVRQAKARTGIATDTDLIEFALANVALEDRFAESFKAVRGSVDPELDLGF